MTLSSEVSMDSDAKQLRAEGQYWERNGNWKAAQAYQLAASILYAACGKSEMAAICKKSAEDVIPF